MPMRKISLDDLRLGMRFSKSLFDSNLNIVLPAGKTLDEYTINNMKSKHISNVETAGELMDEKEVLTSPAPGRSS